MKNYFILLLFCFIVSSCNTCSRDFGGTQTIQLEKNRRVVNVTWKDSDLWVLTKEDSSTKASTFYFKEKSNLSVMSGEVIIHEK